MTGTFFSPNRVEEITVLLKVKLANGRGEHAREMTFTDKEHGFEQVSQLADLLLSACDLAASRPASKSEDIKP